MLACGLPCSRSSSKEVILLQLLTEAAASSLCHQPHVLVPLRPELYETGGNSFSRIGRILIILFIPNMLQVVKALCSALCLSLHQLYGCLRGCAFPSTPLKAL